MADRNAGTRLQQIEKCLIKIKNDLVVAADDKNQNRSDNLAKNVVKQYVGEALDQALTEVTLPSTQEFSNRVYQSINRRCEEIRKEVLQITNDNINLKNIAGPDKEILNNIVQNLIFRLMESVGFALDDITNKYSINRNNWDDYGVRNFLILETNYQSLKPILPILLKNIFDEVSEKKGEPAAIKDALKDIYEKSDVLKLEEAKKFKALQLSHTSGAVGGLFIDKKIPAEVGKKVIAPHLGIQPNVATVSKAAAKGAKETKKDEFDQPTRPRRGR